MNTPAPGNGKIVGWIHAVKGMTLQNVLIAALMSMIAIALYFTYRVLNDPATLDKFLSSYSEVEDPSGCTVRTARMRGGPVRWSVATGFALSGSDRYTISVILHGEPKSVASYCATLGLMIDKLQLQGGNDAR